MPALVDAGIFFAFYSLRDGHHLDSLGLIAHLVEGLVGVAEEVMGGLSAILKSRLEMVKLAREWGLWSRRIAEAAKMVLGGCEVYVFGSVAEGRAVGEATWIS